MLRWVVEKMYDPNAEATVTPAPEPIVESAPGGSSPPSLDEHNAAELEDIIHNFIAVYFYSIF